jgi:hypothetical protein
VGQQPRRRPSSLFTGTQILLEEPRCASCGRHGSRGSNVPSIALKEPSQKAAIAFLMAALGARA